MKLRLTPLAFLLGAALAAAQEPPPPPIEPELGPGSRLVDAQSGRARAPDERAARGRARVRARGRGGLRRGPGAQPEAPAHERAARRAAAAGSSRRRRRRRRRQPLVLVRRDRRSAALDKEQNVWTSGAVPRHDRRGARLGVRATGTVVPLADFLYADPYARLMEGVQRGVYLGVHEAAGVPCHHLSFEQATIDWQMWIDAGTRAAAAEAGDRLQDRGRGAAVRGDDPQVEPRGRGCRTRSSASSPPRAHGAWRSPPSRPRACRTRRPPRRRRRSRR